MNCQRDWLDQNIEHALNHFGRTTEPKKVLCDLAWYKSSRYIDYTNGQGNYDHYFVNDLLGQRIPISEVQYNNPDINNPKQITE